MTIFKQIDNSIVGEYGPHYIAELDVKPSKRVPGGETIAVLDVDGWVIDLNEEEVKQLQSLPGYSSLKAPHYGEEVDIL